MSDTGRAARLDPTTVLAPCVDLVGYFAAIGFGASAQRGQTVGFVLAALINLASLLRAHLRSALRWTLGRYLVLVAVTLLAFFLRSGVLGLLMGPCGWPAQAAIGFAVIATAAVMRSGFVYCAEGASLRLGSGQDWRTGALGLMLCAWLLRLTYCGQIELLPTEAYYWNYSRHLDFGYLDHPPMVALLIRAGTAAFGNTELGVRVTALLASFATAFFIYRLTRNLFGEPSAWVAVVLTQTLPFFFLSGMVMTPDAPLTAAWTASLYYLERALIAERARAWWGAGLCLGLGMLSKYTIGLLGAAICLFMLLDARSRIWWRRAEPYGAALLAFAIFSPVILWNAQHDWASFAFQGSRRLAEKHQFSLHMLIASAIVLLTPTGVAAATALLRRRAPSCATDDATDRQRAWRFLQISLGVPLAVFTVFSLFHEINLDWPGPAWIAAVPVMAFGIVHAGDFGARGFIAGVRAVWLPTLLALLVFDGLRFYYFTVGIPGFGYGEHPENIPVGWRELGRQIHDIAKGASSTPLIVGMDRYFLAGELAFYAPHPNEAVGETTSAHLFGQAGLMYERWFPHAAERGRTLLLVAWHAADLDAPEVRASVDALAQVHAGELRRNGNFVRPYYYRFAYGYRGLAPEPPPKVP
ncbi:MAG TPA: glycosyltransferase family 39 protein [Steroidobacteraceae bacterium]